jgi:hypothetical protein
VPSQISKAGGSPVAVRGFAAALSRTFKPRGLFSAGSSEICPYRAWIRHRAKIPRENHTVTTEASMRGCVRGSQGVHRSRFAVNRFAVVPFKIRSDLCVLCASVVNPPFRGFGVRGSGFARRLPFARNGALASYRRSCGLAKGAGITFRTLGGTASVPSQISKAGGSPVAVRGFAAALSRTFKPRGLFSAGSSEICPYRAWIRHCA